MKLKFFRERRWFTYLVLIGFIFVGLISIISGYYRVQKTYYGTEADKGTEVWGVKRWTKIFGDPCYDAASSFQQTSDGGYIIGGDTGNCTPNINGTRIFYPFLLKTDTNGNKVWQERYKGFALSIQQTTDGGYIAAGTINLPVGAPDADLQADVYLLKTDKDGNVIWEKNYGEDKTNGGDTLDEGRSVQQTSDGGYIIVGDTKPYGMRSDVYLLKTDADGNLQWKKIFDGNKGKHAHSVQQTSDGGYIVVGWIREGYINGTWKDEDTYLIKTDENGNKVWESIVDALGQHEDDSLPGDAQQTSDGGYIILGRSMDYLLKIDANGNKVWGKAFGFYSGYSVQQTSDGGYIIVVVGERELGDFLIKIKIDENGNKVWEKTIEKISAQFYVSKVKQTFDEGYVVLGQKEYGTWGETGLVEADIFLMKIDETSIPRSPIEVPSTSSTNSPTLPAENASVSGKGWTRTFGELDVNLQTFSVGQFQQTSDSGYIATGYYDNSTYTPDGQIGSTLYYVYLLKVDANGNQWNKTYGRGAGNAVKQTADGGYIIAAVTFKRFGGSYLLKTDANGNIQWNKTFEVCDGFYPEDPRSVQQTTDGGYLVAGLTVNCGIDKLYAGGVGMFLLKLDANGNEIWEKIVKGSYGDMITSFFQATDGGYMAVIYTSLFGAKQELYLIKVDTDGNTQWNKTFGEYTYNTGSSVRQTSDDGYIFTQGKRIQREDENTVLKIDANGNMLWEKTFKLSEPSELLGDGRYLARITSFIQTSDGGYIAVALKGIERQLINDFYLVKFDENGNETWYKNVSFGEWPGAQSVWWNPLIQQTLDGGYIVSVTAITSGTPETIYHPEFSYYLLKTDENGNV
jgi:hypothetical protein